MYRIVATIPPNDRTVVTQIEQILGAKRTNSRSHSIELTTEQAPPIEKIQNARALMNCDINILPLEFNPKEIRLVISDMDSTLINIECIDEIADFANLKPHVSAITEAAMRGELDFAQSLKKRVKLLSGLSVDVLDRVYTERLKLNPGADVMLSILRTNKIRFALVSGGFTFFTERLKQRLDLDYVRANVLETDKGLLTGNIVGDIIGADAKRDFLLELCQHLAIKPEQTIAIGDGANDLKMLAIAGLGVAYHAKPKVQALAACNINFGGLNGVLDLLGLDY